MTKLSFAVIGLPAVIAAGSLTVLGVRSVRAAAPSAASSVAAGDRAAIPAGTFLMGSEAGADDEKPIHRVSGEAFAIDRYEVTNGRYRACVQAGACTSPALASSFKRPGYYSIGDYDEYPVIHVSWAQAATFCTWAGGRLPTEAEWERAARGTADGRTFPWGDSAPDCTKANYAGCVGDTDRVGQRPAGQSPYGIDDMAGNVWEWTADWYEAGYYSRSPEKDPTGPDAGALKVMRGGCWVSGANSLRATCRKAELPSLWAPNVGFRCAYDAEVATGKGGPR